MNDSSKQDLDWVPQCEASTRLDISGDAVRNRGRRGTLSRKPGLDGEWLYGVPKAAAKKPPMSVQECLEEEFEKGESVTDKRYLYLSHEDEYVFTLKSYSGFFRIPGEDLRALWRAYTTGATIADVTREFAMDRNTFEELRRALGLTHTRMPVTDEDLAAGDEDELVYDVLRGKERKIARRADAAYWREVEADAHKWRNIHRACRDMVASFDVLPAPVQTPSRGNKGQHLTVIGTTDFHVGKREHGQRGDNTYCLDLVQWSIKAIEETVEMWGAPSAFLIPIGSDLLHTDSKDQKTTAGTPMGTSSVGSTYDHLKDALSVMATVMDYALGIAPVEAVWIPGNHDEVLSYTIALALEQRYANNPAYRAHTSQDVRKYIKHHDVPIMVTHGHALKENKVVMTLAQEMPRGCDIRCGVVLMGHLHHHKDHTRDNGGVHVVTLSSPSPHDTWHHGEGYDLSKRKITTAKISPGVGLVSTAFTVL